MTYRGGSYLFRQYVVCAMCCVAWPFDGSITPSQARQWTSYCASPFSILPTVNCKPNLSEGRLYGDPEAMRWEQGVCFTIFHIFMCPLGK